MGLKCTRRRERRYLGARGQSVGLEKISEKCLPIGLVTYIGGITFSAVCKCVTDEGLFNLIYYLRYSIRPKYPTGNCLLYTLTDV